MIAARSGLGASPGWLRCSSWGLMFADQETIRACQDWSGTQAADAYQYVQYGPTPVPAMPPGPLLPGSTGQDYQRAYEQAQQEAIRDAERRGWHSNPTLGVTASDVQNAVDQLEENIFNATPFLIGIAAVALVLYKR